MDSPQASRPIDSLQQPLRVGIGGPVGSGKTALCEMLCKKMRDAYDMAVITNDIYTREDAEFLLRAGVLPADRVIGVETGGCPHTAIRDDTSMNMAAALELERRGHHVALITDERGAKIPGKPESLTAHVLPAGRLGKNPLHWPKGIAAILEGKRMAERLFESFQPACVVGFGGSGVVSLMNGREGGRQGRQ